jgi:entericidin B
LALRRRFNSSPSEKPHAQDHRPLIVAAALAVSACNTVSGVGRDVSAAGSAVTSGAESAKH